MRVNWQMPPTSQGLMPSVGDTQLRTACIKTFNAQFLKQKQLENSRQDCCSYYEKGHPAGTKSTRISLFAAISESNTLFSKATSSYSPYFPYLTLGLHTQCPHPSHIFSPPEYLEPHPFWCFLCILLTFPAPILLVNGIRHPAFIHLFKQVPSPLHNNVSILRYCI